MNYEVLKNVGVDWNTLKYEKFEEVYEPQQYWGNSLFQ